MRNHPRTVFNSLLRLLEVRVRVTNRERNSTGREVLNTPHNALDVGRGRNHLDTRLVEALGTVHLVEGVDGRRRRGCQEQRVVVRTAAVRVQEGAFGVVAEDVGRVGRRAGAQ
jgi:hypothetical protein